MNVVIEAPSITNNVAATNTLTWKKASLSAVIVISRSDGTAKHTSKKSGNNKRLFWLTKRLEAGVINPIWESKIIQCYQLNKRGNTVYFN